MRVAVWNTTPAPPQEQQEVGKGSFFEFVEMDDPREKKPAAKKLARKVGREMKAENANLECDACGWSPSLQTRQLVKQWQSLIHAHHMVPVSCRGEDARSNIAFLCPTCHAIAHRLHPIQRVEPGDNDWTGPTDREVIISQIRNLRQSEKATTGATTESLEVETA